jgi:hypothetical protein
MEFPMEINVNHELFFFGGFEFALISTILG